MVGGVSRLPYMIMEDEKSKNYDVISASSISMVGKKLKKACCQKTDRGSYTTVFLSFINFLTPTLPGFEILFDAALII